MSIEVRNLTKSFGSFVALPIMHFLIELTGWQQSLLWLMAITALLIPLAWPIGGKPQRVDGPVRDQKVGEALAEAFRHPSYWLLTAGFFVCGFHVAFIVVHLPAFAVDQGLPSWVGPFALSVVGIANIIGTTDEVANPGVVEFQRDGKTYRIEALDEGDDQLFLVFADRTSGHGSYPAGRFLYAPKPGVSDRVVLDFNQAYNPPCAFTPFATCPLPPPENRLDLAINAGEKTYAHSVP